MKWILMKGRKFMILSNILSDVDVLGGKVVATISLLVCSIPQKKYNERHTDQAWFVDFFGDGRKRHNQRIVVEVAK